jgi:hypothetical protein
VIIVAWQLPDHVHKWILLSKMEHVCHTKTLNKSQYHSNLSWRQH